jgi:N-acetylmuramoyl-L-alanine amidase
MFNKKPKVNKIIISSPDGYALNTRDKPYIQMKAKVIPAGAEQAVIWTSSNPKVAIVDNDGWVKGKKTGVATIAVTAMDGSNKRAQCKVSVIKVPKLSSEFTISKKIDLTGVKIGIDPGHQRNADTSKEPISPNSKIMKYKATCGTQGVKTRANEFMINLEIAFLLREAFQSLGAEVYMTRESHDVNISNIQRAKMMNALKVDLALKLHCNSVSSESMRGIDILVRKAGAKAEKSLAAASALSSAIKKATGTSRVRVCKSNGYTGLNWSEIPSVIVEMGFMSNPKDDVLLSTRQYQEKLVFAMVMGAAKYLGR